MADWRISKRLKDTVKITCVTPGMPVRNGNLGNDRTTTTKAASVQKNWVRKIARVTRRDRRRMVERQEGLQRRLTERLVRSKLQWAGHVERMADDRLPKRAAELSEEGRRRQERPRLIWEDCVKRYPGMLKGRRRGRLEEEDKRQWMVEETIR